MPVRLSRILYGLLLLPLIFSLAGCLRGNLNAQLMPDGRGKFTLELALREGALPTFLGNPLDEFQTRRSMQRWTAAGIVAWGEPLRRVEDGWDRLILTGYFENAEDVLFYMRREGKVSRALSFGFAPGSETLHLHPGFLSELEDPLPLPAMKSMGLQIEMSPEMEVQVREALRPMMEGTQLEIRLTMPGRITRADGFTSVEGRSAILQADADLLNQAFREKAGVLVDGPSLSRADPSVQWEGSSANADDLREFSGEFQRAVKWWGASAGPR